MDVALLHNGNDAFLEAGGGGGGEYLFIYLFIYLLHVLI